MGSNGAEGVKQMTVQTSGQTPRKQERDPDLANAEIAMNRAACKAREIARRTGTSVVFLKDGEIREEQGNSHVHS
jgi:hypothetical protein